MKMNWEIRLFYAVILIAVIAAPLSAQGWSITAATANNGNDIAYSFAEAYANVSIRVRSPARNMNFFVTIDGGTPSHLYPRRCDQGAAWVDFDIYQDTTYANLILPATEASISEDNVISGRTSPWTRTVTSFIRVPEAQSGTTFPTGDYIEDLTVSVYEGTFADWLAGGGTAPAEATRNLRVTINITNNFVRVFVAEDGGTWDEGTANATLDFGTLSTGLTRSMDVLVKSYPRNGYTLNFHSANGGALAPVIPGPPAIPYTFYFEGGVQSLVTDYTSPEYPDMASTDLDPDVYDIDFEIGTVDPVSQLPGEYSDIITITLTAVW